MTIRTVIPTFLYAAEETLGFVLIVVGGAFVRVVEWVAGRAVHEDDWD